MISFMRWSGTGIASITLVGALSACSGNDVSSTTAASTATTASAKLTCDDSMKTSFKPDANTSVLLVKAFKKGDSLLLTGTADASTPTAADDMCLVKILVGPGHADVAGAPSATPGIGIEVLLPTPANWKGRVHLLGGQGMAGGSQTSLTAISGATTANPWDVAGVEGAVAATTDTGHPLGTATFLMNSDGTINTVGWNEFSERGIHEMTLKTKALAQAYYGSAARYTYWDGGSTGGRQGLKQAQAYPEDFDGIVATSPAINWTRFMTSMVYGQVAIQRDLGGVAMTTDQINAVSNAAISACDLVGGQHLGYLMDPSVCTYDPTTDQSVLCVANGGTNTTASCVTPTQANVLNKAWYGQTSDGSVPSPAVDLGYGLTPAANQLWYGYPRGASIGSEPFPGFGSDLGPTLPFFLGSDMVALELQDSTLTTPAFDNASGNGANGWKNLSYAQLAHAHDRGIELQAAFSNINTDNPDLSKFQAKGGKLITVYGISDNLIPYPGMISYYNQVATQLGGMANVQSFYKLYLVPGMGHFPSNGTTNANANPPIPTPQQTYALLTDWVENGNVPGRIDVSTPITTDHPVSVSQPICVYPQKAAYVSGSITVAASYTCS